MLPKTDAKLFRKFLLFWPILLFILCVGGISIWIYWNNIELMRPVSERMGIDSMEELEKYMDETFKKGMSGEAVHQELAKFGDYKSRRFKGVSRDEFCEKIEFPTGNTILFPGPRLEYAFCYALETDTFLYWVIFS